MKHPDREEWVPFLSGEANSETRTRLARHLEDCPVCALEIRGWQRSLDRLDAWTLPARSSRLVLFRPAIKWALAAAFVLGFGLVLGRWALPARANVAELRAQIEASVRDSLRAELEQAMQQMQSQTAVNLATAETRMLQAAALERQRAWQNLADTLDSTRTEDARSLQAFLQQFEQHHNAEIISLRTDLETLASTTDQEIRRARQNLVQLAARESSND